ncbi:Heat shock protein beta-1, partial [Fragariocoptes setiger]
MSSDKKLPIFMTDNNLIDQEFDSIRDKFEAEMQKMEQEMASFRSQLIQSELMRTMQSTISSYATSSSSHQQQQQLKQQQHHNIKQHNAVLPTPHQPHPSTKSWLQSLNSPLIHDSPNEGEGKVLKLRFDVTQYDPSEIQVKTVDNRLQVQAKHEEIGDNRSCYREYNREFVLPDGTDPELIKSSLSKDGVLTVEAPLPLPTPSPSPAPSPAPD